MHKKKWLPLLVALPLVFGAVSCATRPPELKMADNAWSLGASGKTREAEEMYAQAAALSEKTNGPGHRNTAQILYASAMFYLGRDPIKAESALQRALTIQEKVLGDHRDTASTLRLLGKIYEIKGELDKAESYLNRSIKISERLPPPGDDSIGAAYLSLAQLYFFMDDLERAEEFCLKAIEKAIKNKYGSLYYEVKLIGDIYIRLGEKSKVEKWLIRDLEVTKDKFAGSGGSRLISRPLNALGKYYLSNGDTDRAWQMFQESLKVINDRKAPWISARETFIGEVDALLGIANIYRAVGNYEKALQDHERILTSGKSYFGEKFSWGAEHISSLIEIYYKTGAFQKGDLVFSHSLGEPSVIKKASGNLRTAGFFSELAFLQGRFRNKSWAADLFAIVLESQNKAIHSGFYITSEAQKLRMVSKYSNEYHGLLSLIQRYHRTDQAKLRSALDAVLSRKGIVFDSQARQAEAIANSLDPETRKLWDEQNSLRAYLARLLQNKPEKMSEVDYKDAVNKTQSRLETLESILASKSALVAENLEQRKATTDLVAKRLPKDSVLAEFVKVNDYDWDKGKWTGRQRYLAFILAPDGRITLVDLGPAEILEQGVKDALARLTALPTSKQAAMAQEAAAGALYNLVWILLKPWTDTASTIIVSPDGALSLAPFIAFRDADGKYLAETKTISYVTSGRDLLKSAKIKPESDLLLVADPRFDMTASATTRPAAENRGGTRSRDFAMSFGPLPGTAEEAMVIPPTLPGQRKKSLTGEQATEEAALAAFRPRVLHLATHGFFLDDQPQASLEDTPAGLAGRAAQPRKGYENPLVRSGLALAGANNAAKAEGSLDGLLTALEVSSMDLHGTDLVTLSACETGVGEVRTGEGVYGLRRAFALAGASHLMMSLWPVADAITADQMKTFYRLYGAGAPAAGALRAAQLETITALRKKYGSAPPSLWAPFIMQGAVN